MASSYGPLHPSRIDKGVAASVAATRQKSCNACVRGKRRCDKKAPKCTRCTAKELDCVYARIPPGATANDVLLCDEQAQQHLQQQQQQQPHMSQPYRTGTATSGSVSAAASVSADIPDFGSLGGFVDLPSLAGSSTDNTSPESSSLDFGGTESTDTSAYLGVGGGGGAGAGAGAMHGGAADFDTMQMDGGDMAGFSIADLFAAGNPGLGGELWDIHSFSGFDEVVGGSNGGSGITKLDPPHLEVAPRAKVRDLTMFKDTCDSKVDPLEVHDARSRPGHIYKVFSDLHITFSQTRALPFLHSRLYTTQLPKPIMAAFVASSAYTNQTPATKGWLVRLLMDTTKEIYSEGERAETPLEKLARVHGLLILNAMRMMDGDIGLRAAAEKELPVMLGWVRELVEVRDLLEVGMQKVHMVDRNYPPNSWESWLLLENIRRTIMASLSFVCLISILRGDNIESELWNSALHFTASRHLWSAQSSLDFYRAWREKPKFLIESMKYTEFWQYAAPEDLDEFTKIMLTTQVGVEAMDHFQSGAATAAVVSH